MENPIVTTEQGQARGKRETDYLGGTYYSFQGLPYAKPPIGNLRFKAPQPPQKWEGIWDATKEGPECYSAHMIYQHMTGSEDCLFLNVFTPQLPTGAKSVKPVMVFIHGGGFTSGSGNVEFYGPNFLITQDIVLVTFNYRIGVLGFLRLDDPSLGVPGNAGMKDMVMALRWIKRNIRNFNGDPNNVTIFGESAGGAAVHLLMLSPMAKGLFHKVISQSGCAINGWVIARNDSKQLAQGLDFTSNDERERLQFLQSIPVEKLYEAQRTVPDGFRVDMIRPHGPVIEKLSPFEPPFLCEDPLHIIMQGKYNKVPLMIGYTSREGMLWDLTGVVNEPFVTNFEQAIPYILQLPKGSQVSKLAAKEIKQFYYGDQEPSLENKDCLYKLHTDNMFFREIHTSARLHATTSKEPVYLYRFSFDGNMNFYKQFGRITVPGACHADDLGYLFYTMATEEIDHASVEANVVQKMIRLWTNFAKCGNPNQTHLDSVINATWKPVTKDQTHFMDIDVELRSGENPEPERLEFWKNIFKLSPTVAKL